LVEIHTGEPGAGFRTNPVRFTPPHEVLIELNAVLPHPLHAIVTTSEIRSKGMATEFAGDLVERCATVGAIDQGSIQG
jgi:hypothetical protein